MFDLIEISTPYGVSEDKLVSTHGTLPDLSRLQERALSGWQVVTSIPKTEATLHRNLSVGQTMGNTWGAGTGGNIVGAFILMKLSITPNRLRRDLEGIVQLVIQQYRGSTEFDHTDLPNEICIRLTQAGILLPESSEPATKTD